MTQEELLNARTNPDFLKYLSEKENNSLESKNIAELYEVLDSLLILDLDENRIHRVYATILEVAFNAIEERLKNSKKLDIHSDDIYFIRAFYEHSIEKWSADDFKGAKELFFILSHIVEDKLLQNACIIKMLACNENEDIESFYNTKVSHQENAKDENYAYFLLDFKFDIEDYLTQNSVNIKEIDEELSYLLGA